MENDSKDNYDIDAERVKPQCPSAAQPTTPHTATPWRLRTVSLGDNKFTIESAVDGQTQGNYTGRAIALIPGGLKADEANAALIVTAVNAHNALVRAADFALKYHKMMIANGGKPLPSQLANALRDALALAALPKQEKE